MHVFRVKPYGTFKMIKHSLFAAGMAIAVITAVALPASATGGLPSPSPDPEEVPEPLTIIGSLVVGGGIIAKKFAGSKQDEA